MTINSTDTVRQLIEIEKQFKETELKWKNARIGKVKSGYWIDLHRIDGIRSNLLSKRQKEISEDLKSLITLDDGTTITKEKFMQIQSQYDLTDEETKSYISMLDL
jgi:hypothetical protein